MTTKIFRNGNSLAVRIPASIKLGPAGTLVEIEQVHNKITLRPAKRSLAALVDAFNAVDPGFMKGIRDRGRGPGRNSTKNS